MVTLMKCTVYIESSIVSYLTARPSNDIRVAANQNTTMRPKVEAVCRLHGYEPPVICTPQELMEG